MANISSTLEKLLFLDITNKQFSRLPSAEYYSTWKELNEEDKKKFGDLSHEAHQIYAYISSPPVLNARAEGIDTFEDYCEHFEVSEELKEIAKKYDLTLKGE